MCVVSMVMDHYGDKWRKYLENPWDVPFPIPYTASPVPSVSPAEIEEFRRLLERAREYDKRHGEPDCELEAKRAKVRDLAKQLGVDVSFIEPPAPAPTD